MGTSQRRLRPDAQLERLLELAPQSLTFGTGVGFSTWRTDFASMLLELIGPLPQPVALEPEVTYESLERTDSGTEVSYQKIVYNTDDFSSALAHVYAPASVPWNGRTILLCHGHDPRKNGVFKHYLGRRWNQPYMAHIDEPVDKLTAHGFSVVAPVWRCFKERDAPFEFHGLFRDPCNVVNLAFGYLGYSLIGLAYSDARRALDLIADLDTEHFSGERVGVVGKSLGGTVGALVSALDPRVKASVISGYLSTVPGAFRSGSGANTCGSQFIFDLMRWGDLPDIFGLIAPRPLLIESGTKDAVFPFDDATLAYERLEEIYMAAEAQTELHRDVADVGHDYIFRSAIPFLEQAL